MTSVARQHCALNLYVLRRCVFQPSFVSEVTAPGRSAMDSVEVAYGRQVSSLNCSNIRLIFFFFSLTAVAKYYQQLFALFYPS